MLDTAAGYFQAGLQDNEFCVWAISEPITENKAKDALRTAIPDLDRHLAARRIELLPGTEWYLEGDKFDLKRISSGWSEKLHGALAEGYAGVRVSGNALTARCGSLTAERPHLESAYVASRSARPAGPDPDPGR